MGTIINSRLLNNNILYKILLNQEEVLTLKNSIKNIHIFAADLCDQSTNLIKKGKNGVTVYFKIPFSLRYRKKKYFKKISYQKLETESKVFYVYVIDKNRVL